MKFEANKILSCGINWESQRHRLNLCIAISFLGTQKTHLLIPCDKLKSANNSDHIGRAHMIILIGFHETRPALPSSLFLHCQSTLSLAFTRHIFALIHSSLCLHLTRLKVSPYDFPPASSSCQCELILYTMCWRQSPQSMTWKRAWAWKSEERQGEWECAPTIQCFIKMSNSKEYRKRDISTKMILGRSRFLGVGRECQKNLIYSNLIQLSWECSAALKERL